MWLGVLQRKDVESSLREDNVAKTLLLGTAEAGKTTLLKSSTCVLPVVACASEFVMDSHSDGRREAIEVLCSRLFALTARRLLLSYADTAHGAACASNDVALYLAVKTGAVTLTIKQEEWSAWIREVMEAESDRERCMACSPARSGL